MESAVRPARAAHGRPAPRDEGAQEEARWLFEGRSPQQEPGPGCNRAPRAGGVCGGALAAALALAALWQLGSAPEHSEVSAGLEDIESLGEIPQLARVALAVGRTGCTNWEDIFLREEEEARNVTACQEACERAPGCNAFSFQPLGCDLAGKGTKRPNTCYLYSGECRLEDNVCWDYFQLERPLERTWCLEGNRSGCENWEQILLEPPEVARSASECGLWCDSQENCTNFGFQVEKCPATATKCQDKHTCMLFGGACAVQDVPYWTLYRKGACGLDAGDEAGNSTASPTPGANSSDASSSDAGASGAGSSDAGPTNSTDADANSSGAGPTSSASAAPVSSTTSTPTTTSTAHR